VIDNSARQLKQDQIVADRDGLQIESVLGDMRDLSDFQSESFDLVFNPCSVSFIPAVQKMFDEAYRVLRPGGLMMCGFVNPLRFIFDEDKLKTHELAVRHRLPYADDTHLNANELDQLRADGEPFIFSHSLENLIGGPLRSGFILRDLFEDSEEADALSVFLPTYFAILAQKVHEKTRST
jgi:ubiquinone/menaquinone biosynthesis C-methylase UbiE